MGMDMQSTAAQQLGNLTNDLFFRHPGKRPGTVLPPRQSSHGAHFVDIYLKVPEPLTSVNAIPQMGYQIAMRAVALLTKLPVAKEHGYRCSGHCMSNTSLRACRH
jgi:hypothetical protein